MHTQRTKPTPDQGSWSLEILLVEHEQDAREEIFDLLASLGHRVHPVSDDFDALATARTLCLDIAIIDVAVPGLDAFSLMSRLRALSPHMQGILASDTPCVEHAVAATRARADYLTKPLGAKNLLEPVSSVARRQRVRAELHAAAGAGCSGVAPILGQSPLVKTLRANIEIIAQASGPVLISGESGSGKELAALTLHASGPRVAERLVTIDCAALAPGAQASKLTDGLHSARGGTLLLDEISTLCAEAQAQLVRMLESGPHEPACGEAPDPAAARVIATTRRDLRERTHAGFFREDLLCLLGEFRLSVPPLRKRRDDLPLLVEHFLEKHRPRGSPVPQVAPASWAVLSSREFRGNVRELELMLKHAMAFSSGGDLHPEHLPTEFGERMEPGPVAQVSGDSESDVIPLDAALSAFEHQYLREALQKTNGNRSRAATLLRISRKGLWAKLKRHRERPPLLTVGWSR